MRVDGTGAERWLTRTEQSSCKKVWCQPKRSCKKVWCQPKRSCKKVWSQPESSCKKVWPQPKRSCKKVWALANWCHKSPARRPKADMRPCSLQLSVFHRQNSPDSRGLSSSDVRQELVNPQRNPHMDSLWHARHAVPAVAIAELRNLQHCAFGPVFASLYAATPHGALCGADALSAYI